MREVDAPDDSVVELEEFLHRFEAYITARWAQIRERVDAAVARGRFLFRCPNCHQTAAVLRAESVLNCLFCENESDDYIVIIEEQERQAPDDPTGEERWNAAKNVDGGCYDAILEMQDYDRKGHYDAVYFVCCGCGSHGESKSDLACEPDEYDGSDEGDYEEDGGGMT